MESGHLRRELGPRQLFMLGFGTIIGVGWIVALGGWLGQGGSIGAILAFFCGALITILIALCYGALAHRYPYAGGEIIYTYKTLGEWQAFVVGCLLVLVYLSTIIFEGIAIGWIFSALFPELEGPVLYSILGYDVELTNVIVMLVTTMLIAYINYRGVEVAARFQEIVTSILIVCTLIFVIAGVTQGSLANLQPYFVASEDGNVITGIVAVLVTAPFWYAGFAVIVQSLGEMSAGTKPNTGRAVLVLSVLAASVFYVLVIFSAAMAIPRNLILSADLPVAAAFREGLQSDLLGDTVLFVGLLGLLATWNALFLAVTRVVYYLAKARFIPERFANLSSTYGTPKTAIISVAIVGMLGTSMGRGALDPVINSAGMCLALIYLFVCLSALRVRLGYDNEPLSIFTKVKLSVVPLIAISASLFLVVFSVSGLILSARGQIPPELIAVGGWAVIGLGVWIMNAKHRRLVTTETKILALQGG